MNLNINTKKSHSLKAKKNRLQSDEIELKLNKKKKKEYWNAWGTCFLCPKPKNKHFLLLYQAREPFPSKISIGKILVCKKIIELECVYILICIYIYCATVYDDYVRRQQEYREQDEEVNVYIIIILFLFFLLEHTKDFF